jgi:quinol monooxygenase YgiN
LRRAKIVAVLTARSEKMEQLRTLLEDLVEASRAEPGNLAYDLWQDTSDPARFVLDELYVSAEAVIEHRSTPHFQAYLTKVNDLAERMSLTLDPVLVA